MPNEIDGAKNIAYNMLALIKVAVVITFKILRRIRNILANYFYFLLPLKNTPRAKIKFRKGTCEGTRTAWVFSFTGVSNEPRVLRQAQALIEAGWRVVVFGYQGHSKTPEEWHFAKLPEGRIFPKKIEKNCRIIRGLAKHMIALPIGRSMREKLSVIYHSAIMPWRNITEETMHFACDYPQLKPDLVIAHDFHTCEVAYKVVKQFDAKFVVDCHEYARGQYENNPEWVKYTKPYIGGMQDYYYSKADLLTTVCEGIGKLLEKEELYGKKVVVVRSVPFATTQEFRPVGDRIKVLYHGDVSPIREIHKIIESMPLWREEFDLTIRGSGDQAYLDELADLVVQKNLIDRVNIVPAVRFNEIIPAANESDIGYFVHTDFSPQKRFVLPNKFFEYIMAGLALCVSDLPEMARITNQYSLGKLVSQPNLQSIADSINSFTRDEINAYKKSSLEAAKLLNWEAEKEVMLRAYNDLFDG